MSYVDAVTKPTPSPNSVGTHTFDINPEWSNLTTGTYRFAIETNVENQYHIIFTADINLAGSVQTVTPSPTYVPSKDPNPNLRIEAMHSVTFTYK
jgi:hypothetical protein